MPEMKGAETSDGRPSPARRVKHAGGTSRAALYAGFGGLLLIVAVASFHGLRIVRTIQKSNEALGEESLLRARLLERIGAELHVFHTHLEHYLLEPESGNAAQYRDRVVTSRTVLDSAVQDYRHLAGPQEKREFEEFARGLAEYLQAVGPALNWRTEERRRLGDGFLRSQVIPQHALLLHIVDQVRSIKELQRESSRLQIERAFQQAGWRQLVAILVTIGLGLLLASFTIRRTLAFERAVESRHLAARARGKEVSAHLIEEQERERRSVSNQLHDEVGQTLSGALVEMANLSTFMRAGDGHAEEKAEEIKKLIQESIGNVRNMALGLRPPILDDLGLIPALEWDAREVSKNYNARVKVDAGPLTEIPDEHKTCLYRAVHDIVRHLIEREGARTAVVTIRQEPEDLVFRVLHDGADIGRRQEQSQPLLEVQERLSLLGGSLLLHPTGENAPLVYLRMPLPPCSPLDLHQDLPEGAIGRSVP